jgi:hypothetical protein
VIGLADHLGKDFSQFFQASGSGGPDAPDGNADFLGDNVVRLLIKVEQPKKRFARPPEFFEGSVQRFCFDRAFGLIVNGDIFSREDIFE